MGRGDPADRNMDGIVGWLDRLSAALENKLAMLLVSALLASAGTLGVIKNAPDSRADPFTGKDGDKHAAMIERLQEQVHALEVSQALDDQHRIESARGYERIRRLEERCHACLYEGAK